MVQSQLTKWAIGMYFTHPAIFVGSMLSALFLKVGTNKLEDASIISEIDKLTEYFAIVTSNLRAKYLYASTLATDSFLIPTSTTTPTTSTITDKLHQAILDLVEGHGKDNQGAMLRFFDERDQVVDALKTEEVEGMQDWLHVVISQNEMQ